MRRLIVVVALLVAFASSARAQAVEASFDLGIFGAGLIELPKAIDADGQVDTQEWLLKSQAGINTPPRWVVVAERADGICFEDWFTLPSVTAFAQVDIGARYGRSKLLVRDAAFTGAQPFMIVSLDLERCR